MCAVSECALRDGNEWIWWPAYLSLIPLTLRSFLDPSHPRVLSSLLVHTTFAFVVWLRQLVEPDRGKPSVLTGRSKPYCCFARCRHTHTHTHIHTHTHTPEWMTCPCQRCVIDGVIICEGGVSSYVAGTVWERDQKEASCGAGIVWHRSDRTSLG